MDLINPTIKAIPFLTEDNFTIWRTQMHSLLNLAKLKNLMTIEGELSPEDNTILTSIIISKLSPAFHSNVITHDNKEAPENIWRALLKHFVLSKPANQACVFKIFTSISFDKANIQLFITKIKSGITHLHNIGFVLPTDILASMVLDKIPCTLLMKSIYQAITHSSIESKITPDSILDQLCIHLNEQRMT